MAARKTPTPKKQAASPDTLDLAEAKLAESGLTTQDAALLQVRIVDNLATVVSSYDPVPGLVFRYFHPITREPLEWWPGADPYERCRKLRNEAGAFGGEKTKGQPKYMQPGGTRACAYFPLNIDWEAIALDPAASIVITEGELKAAKACKEGIAAIGLGGVESFKSNRWGFSFLPELDLIEWRRRNVYIVYDSDTQTNPNVARAVNKLAEKLMERGAFPYYVILPEVYQEADDRKTGLDDYLVLRGPETFKQICTQLSEPLTMVRGLWRLNDKVVYVQNPGLLIDQQSGDKFTADAFIRHRYSDTKVVVKTVLSNGEERFSEEAAAQVWLGWPLRSKVQRLTYDPALPPVSVAEQQGSPVWNTWPGWGCEPSEGDVAPFLQLLEHLFQGSMPGDLQWFLQWLAYPLQYPGTKLFTSVLLWGPSHGTGKSLIGYTMKRIYGRNFTELNQKDLYKDFNSWAENKQFVMGDDITGTDKQHESDILKKFITQEAIRLNIKHLPEYEIPDVINYYFTANGPVAMFLEDDDRRSFVHEVTCGPLEEMFYQEYKLWLDTDGPSALFHYLKHQVDTAGFNPAGRARETQAKKRMIADARSDIGEWVTKLKEDPDQVLRMGEMKVHGDLMTNKQLLLMYDPEGRSKVTANGLGRELRKRGFQYALGGASIKTKLNHDRYYIVRRQTEWAGATMAQVREHLLAHESPKELKF